MADKIKIRGARVHNLKNVDLDLPRDKFIVITGLSGSGKSSLAFDTIYAEGQRRYVESLSAYARQFLGIMEKPDVDLIEGLSPAISIDQKSASKNPRSTVGTITEIYDYMRLLYARIGVPYCPKCGRKIEKQTVNQIIDKIMKYAPGTKYALIAPLIRDKKGEHRNTLAEIQRNGYVRVRIDGKNYSIEEALDLSLDKNKKHTIEVIVDRLKADKKGLSRIRLADSIETALDLGNGLVITHIVDSPKKTLIGKDKVYSEHFSCPHCSIDLPEVEPRNFSFNSPHGACPKCTGLGTKLEVDPDLVIPNKNLSLNQGAIRPWSSTVSGRMSWYQIMLNDVATEYGFSLDVPVKELKKKDLDKVLYGTKDDDGDFEGVIPNMERRYRETDSDYIRSEIERYMRVFKCPKCRGKRLKKEFLSVKVGNKSIADVSALTIVEAVRFFTKISGYDFTDFTKERKKTKYLLSEKDLEIGDQIFREIGVRLLFLQNVGLEYLTIDRAANTLSGGEAQRIRLATQLGSKLVGVVYILDEPSIGLHQRDNEKLIKMLEYLRDLGNTVIVVEHDKATIEAADVVVDIGPGAGKSGGELIAEGSPEEVAKDKNSITGQYLSGAKEIEPPEEYRKGLGKGIEIVGAKEHNLKDINVSIPLGELVCVTGVSGSGKSTLIYDILGKELSQKFHHAKDISGKHKEIKGLQYINKVVKIDQTPIGKTPRSNPATYTGVFTYIRDLFAATPEAKMRGYKSGRFSFNVKGGRCEACRGDGMVKIEMHFLPDVYVECDECKGKRYNKQALEIHYKGKDISDVLNMSVDEAFKFFATIPALKRKLGILKDVGLGYIELGQSATTLSGGEAQRIKLATELSRKATGKTLYILDEPTTGLHFEDVSKLLVVLNRLVEMGNTVLVIEHNMDVIKSADWIIDLGPEGGKKGGKVVAKGTPAQVAKVKESYTGKFLKEELK